MTKREEILEGLKNQFEAEFAGHGYKKEFTPDGFMTQCNFGGLLIIVDNCAESVLVWSDWADEAVSEKLTECEIDYDDEGQDGFIFQDTFYRLSEFTRV